MRKPILPYFMGRAAWRQTAMAKPQDENVHRWKATRMRLRSSAGCAAGRQCGIGRRPSVLCSPRLRAVNALLAAATKRAYADTGHSLDFVNKAFECLDLIGWDHASAVLPSVVGQMVEARGAEESTAWRQPDDLVALCDKAESELPDLFRAGQGMNGWSEHLALARELLGDDPAKIIDALKAGIRAGASASDLSRSLAYGAALRVARFGNANEHSDWGTAHHVFTYANAVDQMLRRIGANEDADQTPVRGVLHGAMALHLTRYLNVPPAHIPGDDGEQLDELPTDVAKIRAALLDAFDRQ
jgi:hypothetical protein